MMYIINKTEDVEGRLDPGAVPGASTINTSTGCFYDGGELGSTDA